MVNIEPAINHKFWFEQSKKMVETAPDSQNNSASKLQTMIGWLWGIYTGAITLSIGFGSYSFSKLALGFIIAPSPILIIAYWLAIWVQQPINLEFERKSPTHIEKAFIGAIKTKSCRLTIALLVSVLAALSVSTALIFASLSTKEKKEPITFAYIHSKNGDKVAIQGSVQASKKLKIWISPELAEGTEEPYGTYKTITSKTGEIDIELAVEGSKKGYIVKIQWIDDRGYTHTLSNRIGLVNFS